MAFLELHGLMHGHAFFSYEDLSSDTLRFMRVFS